MTRRKSRKRKRKQRRKPDPAALLSSAAASLNACDRAGLHPRLRHGIVFTDAGFVLVIRDKWVARPLRKLR